jgi:hypothetical protein
MRLHARRMEPRDVNLCVALVKAHPEEHRRYGSQLKQLPSVWLKLLETGALNTSVVEDMDAAGHIVAFGASVFITDDLLGELKTFPRRWIGLELTGRSCSTISGILSPKQIREANSISGLNLAIWSGIISVSTLNQVVHFELWRSFFNMHAGYRINEVICQPLI